MLLDLLLFAVGVSLLVGGAWLLVTGGARIASLLGVPPVFVGLTVVAWGTSAPELFVSLIATLRGNSVMMLGNIIGSNVANIGLILGMAACTVTVTVDKTLRKRQIPLLLCVTLLFTVLCWDLRLSRWDGLILVVVFVVFMAVTLRDAKRGKSHTQVQSAREPTVLARRGILVNSLLVFLGVVCLGGGGELIVHTAVSMATRLGASEAFIGLTLVAVGTSLPELATTRVATVRRESDIALGNIIGSNLFNLLAVAGPVAAFLPVAGEVTLRTHQLPGLIVMTLLLPLVCSRSQAIKRVWGPILLLSYTAVMVWWWWAGV